MPSCIYFEKKEWGGVFYIRGGVSKKNSRKKLEKKINWVINLY